MRPLTRVIAAAISTLICATVLTVGGGAAASSPHVLLVGTWHGISGSYRSVQAAVRHAQKGDWVLVGPGDYKENGYPGAPEPAGVLITEPGVHLRGMNRNSVVIDGTKRGSPTCSARKADQIFTKDGRDGVQVLKVDGTYVENLTVCNYLTGTNGGEGNEIWWNGGDGSGKIGMGSFWGNYLTGTSTYSNGADNPRGEYGIFTSNARGPGVINHSYASNMGDAAYYIGACPDCNQVLTHAHAQFSALGYSGTNSGGHLTIENSEFDHNKNGATSNSQNNDDAPSPQDGACPGTAKGPLNIGICTVWKHNYFHDNNNPNVPGVGSGLAGASPVGSGMVLAGTRNVALYQNRFVHNGSWAVVVTDLPDQENPPTDIGQNCQGGDSVIPPGTPGQDALCYFDAFGNAVIDNSFAHNGFYGNPTNGDIAIFAKAVNTKTGIDMPGNCAERNTDPAGLSSDPDQIQSNPLFNSCPAAANSNPDPVLGAQLLCATELVAPCPDAPAATYPRPTTIAIHMPPAQPTMPDPCKGVPANAWCPASATTPNEGPTLATTGYRVGLPLVAAALVTGGLIVERTRRRRRA